MPFAVNTQQVDVVLASTTETGKIVEDWDVGYPKVVLRPSPAEVRVFSAWGSFDDSLSADSWICSVNYFPPAAITNFVLELGIGAEGSELTIARWSGCCGENSQMHTFILPIPIKVVSGIRLAFRVADEHAESQDHIVSVQYYQGLEET